MTDAIAFAGMCAAYLAIQSNRKCKRKRFWTRELFKNNFEHAGNLLHELRLEDGSGFRNFVRMTAVDFEELLRMVAPSICKMDTKFRRAITPDVRLAVTLRFLASGDSFSSLQYTFKISKQVISAIVPNVCEAIISSLGKYIQVRT